ncbi:hypothetical protein [Streptomyces xiamenensis]|uniref:hypothetical protein n=1 Tax=Streptomyces xiamenensis TaxID=408015 RepID=UPI0037CCF5FD
MGHTNRAISDDERQRRHLAWNSGLTGESAPPRRISPPGGCADEQCGQIHIGPAPAGMTLIADQTGRGEHRAYCTGRCATYGEALADVRALP